MAQRAIEVRSKAFFTKLQFSEKLTTPKFFKNTVFSVLTLLYQFAGAAVEKEHFECFK